MGPRTRAHRTSRDLRRANRADIFRVIHQLGGTATRAQLAEFADISPATVSVLVNELTDSGVLQLEAVEADRPITRGRPSTAVAIAADYGQLIGIDVAETYVRAQAFDFTLRPVASWSNPSEFDGRGSWSDWVEECCVAAVRQLRRAQPRRPLLGVGLSVPGLVDPESGVARLAPDGRWSELPFGPRLARRLRIPLVHVDNPLRASVLAELWAGGDWGTDDVVVLTLGTGIGAGLAIEGELRRGSRQRAGEWGHIPTAAGTTPADRHCRCGNRGCLEAYLGAPGILQTWAELGGPRVSLDQETGIAALVERIDVDDRVAAQALDRTADQLGAGLVTIGQLVDPAVVVAGGWVAQAFGPRLLEPADRYARARLLQPVPPAGWLRLSELGGNQVTLGAATLALNDVVERAVEP